MPWERTRWIAPDEYEDNWRRYERWMRQKGRKKATVDMNRDGWERFVRFVTEANEGIEYAELTKEHVNDWVESMRDDDTDEQSLCIYFRTARPMFNWFAEETDTISPFYRAINPEEPDNPVPVQEDEIVNRMIAACEVSKNVTGWRKLVALRDEAMVRSFFDAGPRRGELHSMHAEDWRDEVDMLHIRESKTYVRDLVASSKTASAIAKYVRERDRYMALRKSKDPRFEMNDKLWINRHGKPLTPQGINQALNRVRLAAGIPHRVKPGHGRHTVAHQHLLHGGQEGDLVRKMGWNSRRMVDRYGKSAADARSQKAQREMQLGNRLK